MLLVFIPGLIWGASFLFIAEGLRSIGPNGVAFVRILIGFMTLALFPRAWKSVPPSEWLGTANNFLIPPVALLLGVTLRGEHVARLAVAGAAVAVTGAWLMQRAAETFAATPPVSPAIAREGT